MLFTALVLGGVVGEERAAGESLVVAEVLVVVEEENAVA